MNTHASSLSVSHEEMAHLVDFTAGRLRPAQVHNTAVLRQNLRTLLGILIWLAIEAANCTSVGEGAVDHSLSIPSRTSSTARFVFSTGRAANDKRALGDAPRC